MSVVAAFSFWQANLTNVYACTYMISSREQRRAQLVINKGLLNVGAGEACSTNGGYCSVPALLKH
eukprot:14191-Heterococcus_DN1.PRE.1